MKSKAFMLALMLCSNAVWAEALQVERVQLPAWVERDAFTLPLVPGMALRADDVVRTGAGARVLLRMGEGSAVKLGEKAELRLGELGEDKADKSLFRAALDVATGAFRYTTDALFKSRRREVNVRIATVTVGIRGTDVWGRASDDKDIVCLLEGKIEVGKEGYAPVQMSEPLSFYVAPRDGAPQPVAPVDPEKLKQWAAETEVADGQAILQKDGRWILNVISVRSQKEALQWYDRLRGAGYPARIRSVGRTHHLRISDLASEAAANTLALQLQKEFGVSNQDILQRR